MSRGRKAIVQNNSDWESVFYNSVGTYVQYINLKLAKQFKSEPLSNHIRIAGGYAFKSSQYKKQGVPVIRISDFSNEKIVLDDVVYYEESEALERYELHEGDIVIALTGGTIAKLGIVQKGIGKLYLNQRVGKFEVLNPDEFETEYVYWIARSVQSIIKNLAWGAAIPNVSPKQIEELKFPIPDKETQNGIIDFLNDLRANKLEDDEEYFNREVEDFIFSLQANQISGAELQSELIHQQNIVKQLRQAILHEVIQGKLVKQNTDEGNATELLEKIKAQKAKLIEAKEIKKEKPLPEITEEEIPFQIPVNWVWCRLGEICSHISDIDHNMPSKVSSGGVKFLSAKDLLDDGTINFTDDIKHISEADFIRLGRKIIPQRNDIIYSRIGARLGKARIVETDERFLVSYSCCTIRTLNPNKHFLAALLDSGFVLKQAVKETTANSIPDLGMQKIKEFIIPFPPLDEQKRIVIKLEEVMNLCDDLFESINQSKIEIERLIKTLLNDALGVTSNYDDEKDKTLKRKIVKFFTDGNTTETISMKIIEILKTSPLPISATIVWNSSEYSKDIEAFYAELKRLIDIEKLVVEEKRGKESFLKLAANAN